jgi:hypothetical protein
MTLRKSEIFPHFGFSLCRNEKKRRSTNLRGFIHKKRKLRRCIFLAFPLINRLRFMWLFPSFSIFSLGDEKISENKLLEIDKTRLFNVQFLRSCIDNLRRGDLLNFSSMIIFSSCLKSNFQWMRGEKTKLCCCYDRFWHAWCFDEVTKCYFYCYECLPSFFYSLIFMTVNEVEVHSNVMFSGMTFFLFTRIDEF